MVMLIVAFYVPIRLASSSMEEMREAELSGVERWIYTVLRGACPSGSVSGFPYQ